MKHFLHPQKGSANPVRGGGAQSRLRPTPRFHHSQTVLGHLGAASELVEGWKVRRFTKYMIADDSV